MRPKFLYRQLYDAHHVFNAYNCHSDLTDRDLMQNEHSQTEPVAPKQVQKKLDLWEYFQKMHPEP